MDSPYRILRYFTSIIGSFLIFTVLYSLVASNYGYVPAPSGFFLPLGAVICAIAWLVVFIMEREKTSIYTDGQTMTISLSTFGTSRTHKFQINDFDYLSPTKIILRESDLDVKQIYYRQEDYSSHQYTAFGEFLLDYLVHENMGVQLDFAKEKQNTDSNTAQQREIEENHSAIQSIYEA